MLGEKMRITIMAIGSRGDVQPLVALGVGLQHIGHQVHIVAGDEFNSLIKGAKLDFIPLGINIQTVIESHTNIFSFMASIKDKILKASEIEQDAIVATFLGVSTCPIARARKIPFFYAVPMPGLRTREFPNPLFPPLPFGKTFNALTYQLADKHITRSNEDARCLFLEPRPTYLFCFSPHVVPRPSDWGDYAHVTGYWFLNRPSDWQPPTDLEEFLHTGLPPVYVGFGSTITGDPQKMTALVLDALALANQRGVIVTGWGGLKAGEVSSSVFVANSIPLDWLFPRVTAAVHHGGAGTTAAALRAGIPSVIVPFGLDQSFWGRQVKRLGVGTEPIAPKRLTAERLAKAIRCVVEDAQLRDRAATLGEKIRAEDGVGNAVTIIERVMKAG
jgi:sterol 3beta-glucosyltransferase